MAEFDRGGDELPLLIANLDPMKALDGDLIHRVGDRVLASPVSRSTQLRTMKCVPRSWAGENNSQMSLSRSPTCTQRSGAENSDADWRRFSSQGKLSFCSIGTRVGLTLRLRAFVPLNVCRDQNFTAASPSGRPSVVTASEACMSQATQRVHANLTCLVAPRATPRPPACNVRSMSCAEPVFVFASSNIARRRAVPDVSGHRDRRSSSRFAQSCGDCTGR